MNYETPLNTRYASAEMKEIFSPHFKYKTWRKLWVALAEGEKDLGINITDEQIAELKAKQHSIDFEKVRAFERETRHEVMAHIHAYGEDCPDAKGIIHLGATSSYVMDNGDLMQLKTGLKVLKGKLILLIEKLNHLALQEAETPCLGYTHFQPAQATTFGKRICLYLQDFLTDFKDLLYLMEDFPFLGVKGTIGTQSFPRKQELRILSCLASIASSAHKYATDLRLLSHLGEIEEPFGQKQVGSSAMPYKRNPIFSERICGLSRFIMNLWHNSADNASLQWLERSLDDSSNRRLTIPEAFLATDSILNLLYSITDGLKIYPKLMETHLLEHLPYISTEILLAAAALQGKDRQKTHEQLRVLTFEAAKQKKETGKAPDLLKTLLDALGFSEKALSDELKPEKLTGRSKEQVIAFLKLEVEPILEKHLTLETTIPTIEF